MKKVILFVLAFVPALCFCQPKILLGQAPESISYIISDLQNYLSPFKLDSMEKNANNLFFTSAANPKLCGVKIFLTTPKKKLQGTEIITDSALLVRRIYIFGPAESIDSIFTNYLRPVFIKGENFSEGGQWLKADRIMAVWRKANINDDIPLKDISIEFN